MASFRRLFHATTTRASSRGIATSFSVLGMGVFVASSSCLLSSSSASTSSSSSSSSSLSSLKSLLFVEPASMEEQKKKASGVGDYGAVRADLEKLISKPDYEDGSLGPLFVRLAWHASGTYSTFSKDGGSNGGTMRFHPESSDGANAGLDLARNFLESVKAAHPWISYGDLWTLAGAVAIEEMGGPKIEWSGGRVDVTSEAVAQKKATIPPNGRLPDASRGSTGDHLRAVFYRMGFSDQEIVALSGAHALGRCHLSRSGFDGPWTRSPTTFSNDYFRLLLSEKWIPVTLSNGSKQFYNSDKSLMMLPTDLVLTSDPIFAPIVKRYADDEESFHKDFSQAFAKLLDLGVTRQKQGKWF